MAKGWYNDKFKHRMARMGIPTKRPKCLEPYVPTPAEDGHETAEYFIATHLNMDIERYEKSNIDILMKEFKAAEIHGNSKITPAYLGAAKWRLVEWQNEKHY